MSKKLQEIFVGAADEYFTQGWLKFFRKNVQEAEAKPEIFCLKNEKLEFFVGTCLGDEIFSSNPREQIIVFRDLQIAKEWARLIAEKTGIGCSIVSLIQL